MPRQTIYDYGGDLSTIEGLLKEDYVRDAIIETVNLSTYFLSRLTKKDTTAGRRFIMSARFGVGEGQGNVQENAGLPAEGFGEYEQPFGTVVYQYGSLYITGQSIAATKKNRAAFMDAFKAAVKDTRDGFRTNTQRQVWGDGSGTVARVAAGSSGTEVAVTDPYGYEYQQGSLAASERVRLFRRNQPIWFSNADERRTITGVNIGAGTITVNDAVTVTTDDLIVRSNNATSTSQNNELLGAGAVINDTGTYLGIPRAGLPEWQGHLVQLGSGAGGLLSEVGMQAVMDQVDILGTEEPDTLITSHSVRRHYFQLLQSQKRFVNTLNLPGGFTAVNFNDKPLLVDKECPPQRIYFFNLKNWCWYLMQDEGWLNRDGTILKWAGGADGGRDAYRGYWHRYGQLACTNPSNQAVLYDIIGADLAES